ncbi:zinc dependent phospholipase C family protein [Treponema sp. OMZ 787]|uniref:zinc dependent phospholipase C family protein n=1 Tax=Treponema sp. OMZ 787 TaxID=2563669 RepID=UPI0020A2CAB7|nr:zinc dependent phospholipase C family protein [Treponema sp. OMZ 787]UTC63436.1 zinc dependent phospholipase C family protein [Treponema sp. OMZ 787]
MPDFYAHYMHGQKVFDLLSEKTAAEISNKNLYNLGLQGPDFLYFHKPFKKNNNYVLQLATEIHNKNCKDFFDAVLKDIKIEPNTDEFSYMMGFVGHFGLDSCCHPYVNDMVSEMKRDHAEIEMEFEKFLLKHEGLHPLRYKAHNYIDINEKEAEAVANIYKGLLPSITKEDILRSFRTFKIGKRFFYAPTRLSQILKLLLISVLGLYNFLQGHIIRTRDNAKSKITNQKLFSLYNNSIEITAGLMENFAASIKDNKPFLERFNYNFS